jgi:regulator of protease activity HflC (stomatin/prohibitin superfamily)
MSGRLDRSDLDEKWRSVAGGMSPWLKVAGGRWVWVVLSLMLVLTLGRSFVLVGAGERAVIFNRFTGTQPYQLGEGLHFVIPWVQTPIVYDVKTHTYSMHAMTSEGNGHGGTANDALTALTADGLPVSLDLSVLYHVDPETVWKLHREIGPSYLEKIVRPQARSHVRMIVAQYRVVDVYGGRRARIIEEINARLKELFSRSYLVLDEALLRDVKFSDEFQNAIEQKQVAQQEVQRMKYVLQQVDKERRRKIIDAEGEAESIRLKAAALAQNPQLVEYEYVKRLPDTVRTVVTDGRTIVNLGETIQPGVAAEAAQPPNETPTAEGAR